MKRYPHPFLSYIFERTFSSVADPVSGAFLIPGSISRIQDGKKYGSGMNIPDNFTESLDQFVRLKILQFFFDADSDPGSGMEKIGSGIRGKHPGSGFQIY